MGSLTTEIPASATGTTAKRNGADTLESEAIGLDVSVRVHGSQVTAVVLESTEHVEPFEEDTSTMIVFPRGAVVKLQARVRTGHAVVVTNLATKQTALCRIIQVNSTAGTVHYVKLEFSQPEPGFWGVHFPSDPAASAAPSLSALGTEIPARETRASINAPQKAAEMQKPAPAAVTDAPSAVRAQPPPAMNLPRALAKPTTLETIGEGAKSVLPPTVNYGAAPGAPTNEVMPLAAAPLKQASSAPKRQAAAARPQNDRTIAVETPIFDSLSTGEEIFDNGAPAASQEQLSILKTDTRLGPAFGRSLDPSSLLQSVEVPKQHSRLKIFLTAAAVVIIGAGAAFYVRQYQRNARQNAAAAAPAPVTQKIPATTSNNPAPSEATAQTPVPPSSEAAPPQAPAPSARQASVQAPADEGAITVTPVHSTPKKTTPQQSHPTISTGLANIYAGDLAARPHANKRSSAPIQAPVPAINSAPGNLGAVPSNAALGSLVGGSADNSALPKPAEAKPVVRGGVVTPPRLIRSVQPIYPPLAASNHTEGDVQVEAFIDQAGKVVSTKVISGPILLRRAAMDAVRQWRYSPALLDGKAISMQYKVIVSFRLGQ